MTGFYRDGCCNTGQEDVGSHTVCAVMTAGFFEFSKSRGNDLSTPVPEVGFPRLKPGTGLCFGFHKESMTSLSLAYTVVAMPASLGLSIAVMEAPEKTDFAISRPIVETVCIGSSPESWEP